MQPLPLDRLSNFIGHPLLYTEIKTLASIAAPIVQIVATLDKTTPTEYDRRVDGPGLVNDVRLLIQHLDNLANVSLKLKSVVSNVESIVKHDHQTRPEAGYIP